MKPSLAKAIIKDCIDAQQPIFVWGASGIGKSQVVAQVAKEMGVSFKDERLNLYDVTDVKGFPVPDAKTKSVNWMRPSMIPKDGNGILFLDEFVSAAPAVQATTYQLILDRAIGEHRIGDGWAMVAAGNREGDRGIVHRMPAPLANRFIHIEMEPDLDDFVNHQLSRGMTAEQVAFHRFCTKLLHSFDPQSSERAFPTPRSWEIVDKIRKMNIPYERESQLITGAVGQGATAEFYGFMKVIKDLPSVDEILLNPDGAPVPKTPAGLYAVTTMTGTKASDSTFSRLLKYAERLPIEFQVVFIRDAMRTDRSLSKNHDYTKWVMANNKVLV